MIWNLEQRKLSELIESPKNPRRMSKHDAEHLKRSLSKFGVCEPIVINQDNQIIGGHQRVKTLKNLGVKETAVMLPTEPLSEKEADELNIRLNKNTGYFDDDLLANAWDVDLLCECGFTLEELHLHPEEEDSSTENKGATLTIFVKDNEHANMLERHLTTVLCEYPGSKLKVKQK